MKASTIHWDIEKQIFLVRGHRVMMDKDLAELYQVKPIALRQQVKRNMGRFPSDFMFPLTRLETEILVSQNVIPSLRSLGGALPYVFTQEGVAMLSGVLRSRRAIRVNIAIMKAFVKLRQMMAVQKDALKRLDELERKFAGHDIQMQAIFKAIRELMTPPKNLRPRIGFKQ